MAVTILDGQLALLDVPPDAQTWDEWFDTLPRTPFATDEEQHDDGALSAEATA